MLRSHDIWQKKFNPNSICYKFVKLNHKLKEIVASVKEGVIRNACNSREKYLRVSLKIEGCLITHLYHELCSSFKVFLMCSIVIVHNFRMRYLQYLFL